jgi:mRNA degradation ribonuclease J1/J2
VLALCTGSQGEPRAALARIANDDHPEVTLNKGDCVIFSSRTIPGNEKAVGASSTAWSRRASRSSPTAPIWSMSPAIRAATSCAT